MNYTTVAGNITANPELRFLNSGTATSTLSIAVNRRYKDKNSGEFVESTSYFDVVAWAELAEHAASSFSKGDRIIVTGRMEQRSWTTDTGDKRNKIEIIADDIGASVKWGAVSITKQTPSHSSEPF